MKFGWPQTRAEHSQFRQALRLMVLVDMWREAVYPKRVRSCIDGERITLRQDSIERQVPDTSKECK